MTANKLFFSDGLPAGLEEYSFILIFNASGLLVKKIENGSSLANYKEIKAGLKNISPPFAAHFLGREKGASYYCFQADDNFKITGTEFEFRDLRSLINCLDETQFRFACLAAQVLYWDKTTKFCGECGALTRHSPSERAKICTGCARVFYPAVTPAIIVAVMNQGKMLLAHNKNFAEGVYSLIAGFVEPGESLEDCVAREVLEETGVSVSDVKYFKSQPWPFPSSMMIGFTASYKSGDIKPDGEEIIHAAWFGREELPKLPRPGSLSRNIIDIMMSDIN
ncbi:MAG TPA: NAD(+) diphosphatase [Candidatus Wallbacteria bacterium]|nr:MAG: NADH pyrophosphatase [bacterium ADurb.Bin243]HOD39247.1 NAD(+) diphosphatase [Candidatus Wallbacteria bacterium]HPG58151.1 NAD(+) diphosphatase [Candidatus Wallbacteria bacterium]